MNPNNHIEQLIHNLCPSGVPHKTLGEIEDIGIVTLGRGNIISKETIIAHPGDYPVYSSSSQGNGEMGRYGKYMFTDQRISWSIDGGGKFFFRDDTYYSVTNVCGWLKVNNKKILDIKYLYYILYEQWVHKRFDYTLKAHPSVIRDLYLIPLPPLPIQEEIVRILDTFTELITNIDTEIQKQQCELDLCRKQIFHQLNCKYEQLSSIFDMRGGYTPSTKNPEYWTDNTGYSWYTMDDIRKNGRKLGNSIRHITEKAVKGKGLFPKGTIVFATSATIGEHAILMKPALTNQRFTAIIPKKDDVYMMFYYHYAFIIDKWCLQHIKRGGFNSVDMDGFAKLPIPLPPLSEQRAIAEKLDTFEKLITNLKTERDLRQQQYEYYREKLINLLK